MGRTIGSTWRKRSIPLYSYRDLREDPKVREELHSLIHLSQKSCLERLTIHNSIWNPRLSYFVHFLKWLGLYYVNMFYETTWEDNLQKDFMHALKKLYWPENRSVTNKLIKKCTNDYALMQVFFTNDKMYRFKNKHIHRNLNLLPYISSECYLVNAKIFGTLNSICIEYMRCCPNHPLLR